jgi:hypothetical protein
VRAATGADALVPAGLAWQAARGWPAIGARCREVIDAGFGDNLGITTAAAAAAVDPSSAASAAAAAADPSSAAAATAAAALSRPLQPPPPPLPLPLLPLPRGPASAASPWAAGEAGGIPLYRDKGASNKSKYCSAPIVSPSAVLGMEVQVDPEFTLGCPQVDPRLTLG